MKSKNQVIIYSCNPENNHSILILTAKGLMQCRIKDFVLKDKMPVEDVLKFSGTNHTGPSPVHIKGAESLGIFKDRISKCQPKFLNRFKWYIKLFLFIMFISNYYLTL